ncbi:aspartyl-phosphate phosphatase Spo0E family protein [Ectobacillus ponti]|uniref:Aspartyl-phosphate phosphatase Spo0E family protein n=1 Tax=Ectobacillus ponti TaxID=2961894 RepID=A0AA41X3S2_9BACI|nr:aspartyl-phosphate phosphatase Spo0E family protein [Ectobacillus ponti]MCP8968406.1 aspartyl-phosphate phosphatase Spo0E family protein [Ectobacillus ponti]
MGHEQLRSLSLEIETMRSAMHETASTHGLFHAETIRISQILDYLILQYQKLAHESSLARLR